MNIELLQTISPESVRLRFDTSISDDPFFLDPDTYCFSDDLQSLAVLLVDDCTVEIVTTSQKIDHRYELRIRQDG
jgi:hypothetical protein